MIERPGSAGLVNSNGLSSMLCKVNRKMIQNAAECVVREAVPNTCSQNKFVPSRKHRRDSQYKIG